MFLANSLVSYVCLKLGLDQLVKSDSSLLNGLSGYLFRFLLLGLGRGRRAGGQRVVRLLPQHSFVDPPALQLGSPVADQVAHQLKSILIGTASKKTEVLVVKLWEAQFAFCAS